MTHTGGTDQTVGIIGAGVVGCAAAYFLARAGARVTVFDAVAIAAGASGRNSGAVEHPYDPEQESLYLESVNLLGEVLGEQMPASPAGVMLLVEDEAKALACAGHYSGFPSLGGAVLGPDVLASEEPFLADDLWACRLETGYPVVPQAAAVGFADRARELGARFELGTPASILHEQGRVTGVTVGGERRHFDSVLLAGGADSAAILGQAGESSSITPLWGVSIAVDMPRRPRHILLEGTLAEIQAGGPARDYVFSLIGNADHLALGSTFLPGEPDADGWVERLRTHAIRFYPSVSEARVLNIRSCARPRSFDGRPLLGGVVGQPGLWIASGHGGRGISTGPASARLVAESIRAGTDDGIPESLRASRQPGLFQLA